jgi:hypothetical protein
LFSQPYFAYAWLEILLVFSSFCVTLLGALCPCAHWYLSRFKCKSAFWRPHDEMLELIWVRSMFASDASSSCMCLASDASDAEVQPTQGPPGCDHWYT